MMFSSRYSTQITHSILLSLTLLLGCGTTPLAGLEGDFCIADDQCFPGYVCQYRQCMPSDNFGEAFPACVGEAPEDALWIESTVVDSVTCNACGGHCLEEEMSYDEVRFHTAAPLVYCDGPPTGGPHDSCWGDWGTYSDEPLEARHWVHNLEHGAIVFLYNCPSGCDDELADLMAYLETYEPKTIVTPYPSMNARFAMVAWEHRLLTDCVDAAAFDDFFERLYNQGPEPIPEIDPPSGCM